MDIAYTLLHPSRYSARRLASIVVQSYIFFKASENLVFGRRHTRRQVLQLESVDCLRNIRPTLPRASDDVVWELVLSLVEY